LDPSGARQGLITRDRESTEGSPASVGWLGLASGVADSMRVLGALFWPANGTDLPHFTSGQSLAHGPAALLPKPQLDHINGADGTLENLQLMCDLCHRAKTGERIVVAPPHVQHVWPSWWKLRVEPANPMLLADDQYQWKFIWQELKSERKQRLKSLPVDLKSLP